MGSETSQYHEEKKPIGISLVAASESESSPNAIVLLQVIYVACKSTLAGCKAITAQQVRTMLQIVR